ncbi:LCP family protein [Micromonospora fulviviridis]|uniref:LCP family protein n=1 Tax=Micromonospora fulviviridis TaxID=47860 RepID=UPI0037AC60BB
MSYPITAGPSGPVRPRRSARRPWPRWARWCVAVGTTLMTLSGVALGGSAYLLHAATGEVTRQNLLGAAAVPSEQHRTITGAKNVLLVGVDTRPNQDPSQLTRADSIMLLHVPADHTQAYLVSLPRDSLVTIPAYDNGATPFRGGQNKINSAFAFGSRGLTGSAALSHGFELLALTVRDLTGITPDAGAIIDFQGFKQIVQVLGQVCMYVDETTTSIHVGHDAAGKPAAPYAINPDGTVNHRIAGVTPNVYTKGQHCLDPTQALDFVRQRDLLADHDFDYGRQRHQQQFVKAVLTQVVSQGLDSPTKLPGLLSAVGRTMTVDDGGIPLADWAFAMRGVKPDSITTIKTNGGTFNSRTVPGVGSAEILSPTSLQLLRAVRDDTVAAFVAAHPGWVADSTPASPAH